MTDPIADRTAPGMWRIAYAGAHDYVVSGQTDEHGTSLSTPVEADARFIVYCDRTIEAYEAVAEAARLVFDHHNCHCLGHVAVDEALDALDTAKEAGR